MSEIIQLLTGTGAGRPLFLTGGEMSQRGCTFGSNQLTFYGRSGIVHIVIRTNINEGHRNIGYPQEFE